MGAGAGSPALRFGSGRMPEPTGKVGAGSAQLGFGHHLYHSLGLEPRVLIGLHPDVDLEINSFYEISSDVTGSAGIHYRFYQGDVLKLSIGAGGGLGYSPKSTDMRNGDDVPQSLIYGGFFELGTGFRFNRVFGIYFNHQVQVIGGDPIYDKYSHVYVSHSIGLHFDWNKTFYSTIEASPMWMWNEKRNEAEFNFATFYTTILGVKWGGSKEKK